MQRMIEYFISLVMKMMNNLLGYYYTEVRWLSKGACLTCFIELYEGVVQFLVQQNEIDLSQKLKMIKSDAFYLFGRNIQEM